VVSQFEKAPGKWTEEVRRGERIDRAPLLPLP
jgi:hypothetical protein